MRVKHMVFTNYSCDGHLDYITWTIYVNFYVLMPRKLSLIRARQQILVELYCFRLVCPSVCGNSNSVILMGFLPNFKYALLPSNSRSSMNTGERLLRWPTKWPQPMCMLSCRGHSNSVIFNQLSFKFYI